MPLRLEMLTAPAWAAVPVPLRRILERLEVEHLKHGGRENGWLRVDYSQFVDCGVSRRQISALLSLGERLGLLDVGRGLVAGNGIVRPPNTYRLTYVPERGHRAPTDEWSFVTEAQAQSALNDYREAEKQSRHAKEPMSRERSTANVA